MYVVYKLFFKTSDNIYIGLTNNIAKRIRTHKWEALCNKNVVVTHKINWLRKYLKNDELLYEIIYKTDNKKDAYKNEKEFILQTKDYNVNTYYEEQYHHNKRLRNYDCMTQRFGKEYIILSKDGEIEECKSLKKYSEYKKINYKNMHACVSKKSHSSHGYRIFYKTEWDLYSEIEKNEIIKSFIMYNRYKTKKMNDRYDRIKKKYCVISKNGVIVIDDLVSFCVKNNINLKSIYGCISKHAIYKGLIILTEEAYNKLSIDIIEDFDKKIKNYKSSNYKIETPSGEIVYCNSYNSFCKQNNLSSGGMSELLSGKITTYKGYKIFKVSASGK